LTNFNISVGLTEAFMEAVESGADYGLVSPRTGEIVKQLPARDVFNLIVHQAWLNGEPGIVFLDRINADNPTPELGEIESTNPCGEQPLLPYESCNLGSVNLAHMVNEERGEIDYGHLARTVETAVRFLDNVIDRNHYPLEVISEQTRANRKIGLGVMGFADMLIKLSVAYSSEEALQTGRRVMQFIEEKARAVSARLAEERGVFPNFERSRLARSGLRLRNATITTIAPTGTLSIIAGCSSGVEPLFAVVYTRTILDNQTMLEVHPLFEQIAKARGFYSQELMEEITRHKSPTEIAAIPEEVRRIFATAYDVTPEWHIRMQAAFQEHTDNAVSKTVNFRKEAAEDDVRAVYMLAYRLGCKGVTVYRDESRESQVLRAGSAAKPEAALGPGQHVKPRPRPPETRGSTLKVKTGCGNLYITINEDEHGLCEVFTSMGKTGGCTASQSEAISRLISLALRAGVEPSIVTDQLKGIRCPMPSWENGGQVLSCADAIAKAIERYLRGREARDAGEGRAAATVEALNGLCPQCPECGGMVERTEGCIVCRACGYTKCG